MDRLYNDITRISSDYIDNTLIRCDTSRWQVSIINNNIRYSIFCFYDIYFERNARSAI